MKKFNPNNIKIVIVVFLLFGVYFTSFLVNIEAKDVYDNSSNIFMFDTLNLLNL